MRHVVLAAVLILAACGDDGHDHDHDHDHDGGLDHEMCFGDEDPLSAGTSKLGDDGVFKVHILSWDPDPLIIGNNAFTIRVTDPDDVPVDGVTFDVVETWQRVHDHGTPVVPTVEALADPGEFLIGEMNVIHRGSWLFRFGPSAGGESDFIEFNFRVQCEGD